MTNMTLPNFLVIGAARSGTTSLHHYLRQHPQIFMSLIKEPNFFAYDRGVDMRWTDRFPIQSMEDYAALFSAVRTERAVGEASTVYLYNSAAAERIKATLSDVRLIVMLRDPVERAFAGYLEVAQRGTERRSFAEAVLDIRKGASSLYREKSFYFEKSFYHRHLSAYMDRFGPSRLSVHLYDDYKADPKAVLRSLFRFLGVDDAFLPDMSVKHNVSGLPKNRLVERLLRPRGITRAIKHRLPARGRRAIDDAIAAVHQRNRVKPAIDPDTRQELIGLYRDDILKLQDLIRRDLTDWLR